MGGPGQRVVDRPASIRGKGVAGLRGSPVQQAANRQKIF